MYFFAAFVLISSSFGPNSGYCGRVVYTLQKTLMYMFTIYHGPFLHSEGIHMYLPDEYVINDHITHIGLQ